MDSQVDFIRCPIYKGFKSSPNKDVVFTDSKVYTFLNLHESISSIEQSLRQRYSLFPYQPVSIQIDDTYSVILTFFALLRLGIPVLIINPKSPESEVRKLMEKSNSVALISRLLSFSKNEPTPKVSVNNFSVQSNETYMINPNHWAHIVPTSGSSGDSKLAVLTVGNYISHVEASQKLIPIDNSSMWSLSLPLYHVSGMAIVFRVLLNEGMISLRLSQKSSTHISLVETQLKKILSEDKTTLINKKCILLGGSAISLSLLETCKTLKLNVFYSYGMTESTSQIATLGKVLPHMTLKLEGEEIYIKGPSLFKGYLHKGYCSLTTDHDGFFNTGDLGEFKNDELIIIGRKDRLFISGGENVYPEEIEKSLRSLSYITEAYVISVSDEKFQSKAVVFCSPFDEEILNRLKNDLKLMLPSFKIPKEFLALSNKHLENKLKVSLNDLETIYLNTH
jgi:o-succinylbenzoate---CoA ligase